LAQGDAQTVPVQRPTRTRIVTDGQIVHAVLWQGMGNEGIDPVAIIVAGQNRCTVGGIERQVGVQIGTVPGSHHFGGELLPGLSTKPEVINVSGRIDETMGTAADRIGIAGRAVAFRLLRAEQREPLDGRAGPAIILVVFDLDRMPTGGDVYVYAVPLQAVGPFVEDACSVNVDP